MHSKLRGVGNPIAKRGIYGLIYSLEVLKGAYLKNKPTFFFFIFPFSSDFKNGSFSSQWQNKKGLASYSHFLLLLLRLN